MGLQKFLSSPQVKPLLQHLVGEYWGASKQDSKAAVGLFGRFRQSLHQLKTGVEVAGMPKGIEREKMYKFLLYIAAPLPGTNMLRATARVLGLISCRGIKAAMDRLFQ